VVRKSGGEELGTRKNLTQRDTEAQRATENRKGRRQKLTSSHPVVLISVLLRGAEAEQ
jgi:hypothetical protein